MSEYNESSPTGIRDQLIGKVKFTERVYPSSVSISTIAIEVEKYYSQNGYQFAGGAGSKITMKQTPELVEVTIHRPHSDPFLVVIARVEQGFRVSFIRVRGLSKIMANGGKLLAVGAVLFAPLALIGAGAMAATAGIERVFEAQFWTYIEARIAEISPATPGGLPSSREQSSASELERLWQLRQQGALTQEEFEAQKKEILRTGR